MNNLTLMMSSGITYSSSEYLVALLVDMQLRAALSACSLIREVKLSSFSIPEMGIFIFRSFSVRHLCSNLKGMKL